LRVGEFDKKRTRKKNRCRIMEEQEPMSNTLLEREGSKLWSWFEQKKIANIKTPITREEKKGLV